MRPPLLANIFKTFSIPDGHDSPTIVSLDYDKIKSDLLVLRERPLAVLLQALRWVSIIITAIPLLYSAPMSTANSTRLRLG